MNFRYLIGSVVLIGTIAAGCATTPRATPQLDQARQAYLQAQADPTVAQYAPVPLHEADQLLVQAQNADSKAAREHYSYLTEKKVELARALAAEKAAENQVEQLRAQNQDMLLQMRSRETEKAQTEVDQLRRELKNLEAKQTERGISLTFGNVLFETDRAVLKPGAELSLAKLADFLQSHPDRTVLIEGHTDSQGAQEYNQKLSQRRAEAVARALEAQGVSAGRITATGLGEAYPVASNDTAAGRQQNRRVEVIIQNQGQ
ncbi:MAG: OmpA family protein [Desulfobacterales bacterium]